MVFWCLKIGHLTGCCTNVCIIVWPVYGVWGHGGLFPNRFAYRGFSANIAININAQGCVGLFDDMTIFFILPYIGKSGFEQYQWLNVRYIAINVKIWAGDSLRTSTD